MNPSCTPHNSINLALPMAKNKDVRSSDGMIGSSSPQSDEAEIVLRPQPSTVRHADVAADVSPIEGAIGIKDGNNRCAWHREEMCREAYIALGIGVEQKTRRANISVYCQSTRSVMCNLLTLLHRPATRVDQK
jgi:hypothetical protein